MFGLHFEQVHWIAVLHAVLMGRNRASLYNGFILCTQEIAIRPAVAHETIRFLAGVAHPIFA